MPAAPHSFNVLSSRSRKRAATQMIPTISL
jgi:hypothetical protein